MIKKTSNIQMCFVMLFLVLFFAGQTVFAGTYVYYNEKGERVLYLPKKPDSKSARQKNNTRSVKKDSPAGIPYEHKNKQPDIIK